MNIEEMKKALEEFQSDPDSLKDGTDDIDNLLIEIIKVEKKHLYGLESTSNSRRQDEIKKIIDKNIG